jgi:hypothetical protein
MPVCSPLMLRHLALRQSVGAACFRDQRQPVRAAAVGQDVGQSLDAVDELGVQVGAQVDERSPRRAAEQLGQERQDQAQGQEKAGQNEGKHGVERSEKDGYADSRQHGDQRRGDARVRRNFPTFVRRR